MAISEKQLDANRGNAKKGGVKTDEGKSITRFNAVKHGIFTNVLVSDTEEGEKLDQLRERIFNECKPEGVIEEILVDRIVVCIWRLRRCAIADKSITEQECNKEKKLFSVVRSNDWIIQARMWAMMHGPTELLLQYETTFERQWYRVMRELRELQRMRFTTEQKALPPPV